MSHADSNDPSSFTRSTHSYLEPFSTHPKKGKELYYLLPNIIPTFKNIKTLKHFNSFLLVLEEAKDSRDKYFEKSIYKNTLQKILFPLL